MSFANLARDVMGCPIQTLAPSGVATLSIGAASLSAALPSNRDVFRLAATASCFVRFGTSGVVATNADHLLTPGVEVFKVPQGATHVAVVQSGAAVGVASVSGMV